MRWHALQGQWQFLESCSNIAFSRTELSGQGVTRRSGNAVRFTDSLKHDADHPEDEQPTSRGLERQSCTVEAKGPRPCSTESPGRQAGAGARRSVPYRHRIQRPPPTPGGFQALEPPASSSPSSSGSWASPECAWKGRPDCPRPGRPDRRDGLRKCRSRQHRNKSTAKDKKRRPHHRETCDAASHHPGKESL